MASQHCLLFKVHTLLRQSVCAPSISGLSSFSLYLDKVPPRQTRGRMTNIPNALKKFVYSNEYNQKQLVFYSKNKAVNSYVNLISFDIKVSVRKTPKIKEVSGENGVKKFGNKLLLLFVKKTQKTIHFCASRCCLI
jgi:hypothetical protein